jgi:hypothetical protein
VCSIYQNSIISYLQTHSDAVDNIFFIRHRFIVDLSTWKIGSSPHLGLCVVKEVRSKNHIHNSMTVDKG